ncbi:MAG: hypothetical protein IJS52_02755 [Bacilli bacterium]|nr:hypothetical protein [Bacilli bacterium]
MWFSRNSESARFKSRAALLKGELDYLFRSLFAYDRFWDVCPDGHKRIFFDKVCALCGYESIQSQPTGMTTFDR